MRALLGVNCDRPFRSSCPALSPCRKPTPAVRRPPSTGHPRAHVAQSIRLLAQRADRALRSSTGRSTVPRRLDSSLAEPSLPQELPDVIFWPCRSPCPWATVAFHVCGRRAAFVIETRMELNLFSTSLACSRRSRNSSASAYQRRRVDQQHPYSRFTIARDRFLRGARVAVRLRNRTTFSRFAIPYPSRGRLYREIVTRHAIEKRATK